MFPIADPDWRSLEYMQLSHCLCATGLFNSAARFAERFLEARGLEPGTNYVWTLMNLGRFDTCISICSDLLAAQPDSPLALGDRAMLYSRTGQYERAEADLVQLESALPRNIPRFYHLYWQGRVDEARDYFLWLEERKNLMVIYKAWGRLILGDIEEGIEWYEVDESRGGNPFNLGVNATRLLPPSGAREVWTHPRFRALLDRYGVGDHYRNELVARLNELVNVTGIPVRLDEDY